MKNSNRMKMTFRTLVLLIFTALEVSEISCRVEIATGAIVSSTAILKGHVTIGAGTIVSPSARIIAQAGSINIGQGNIIQDNAVIANRIYGHTQIIGNGNIFSPGSTCEAFRVGDGNIFESNSFVGQRVQLSNGCIIQRGCYYNQQGYISPGSIIGGNNCHYGKRLDKSYANKQVNTT